MFTNLLLDENVDLSNELNLLLDQSNDLQQTNLCPLYNSNITTTHNDDLTRNMVFCDKQYPQPLAPMNYTAMNRYTENNYPVMMPPESFPLPYCINNDETSHFPLQDPTNYLCASGVNPLDPNWDAINAFLAGHVRPGPDVTHVYRCVVCNVEFANPQALGGHMSSHSKVRKNKDVLRSSKPKKFKKTETKKPKKTKSSVKHSSY